MNMLPDASNATLRGSLSVAVVARMSSPLKDMLPESVGPVPATIDIILVLAVSLKMQGLLEMKRFPDVSNVTPYGLRKQYSVGVALVFGMERQ